MNYILAAVACLGHLVTMIGTHNYFYGMRHPKWLGDAVHLAHAVLVLALPVGLILGWGWSLDGLFALPPTCAVHMAVLAYLGFCILVAGVWLPALTIWRASRRQPGSVRSEVVDVERVLGRRPKGNGHQAFLAHLPRNEIF